MAKQLNPSAPEFVPSSYTSDNSGFSAACFEEGLEDHITAEELEELEAAEAWVQSMAMMEEAEQEHLIQVALRYAPQAKVNEIQKRFGVKSKGMRSHHKGIRSRGSGSRAM